MTASRTFIYRAICLANVFFSSSLRLRSSSSSSCSFVRLVCHLMKGGKQRFTPVRVCKYKAFKRGNGKGGVKFVWYAFEVHEQRCYQVS